MFLKKKPGLPKAPDVSQIKDFSLFGASPRSSAEPERERGPQGLASRDLHDVIDVEVVEVSRPAPAQAAAPAPAADTPAQASASVEPQAPASSAQAPQPAARKAAEAAGADNGWDATASAAAPGASSESPRAAPASARVQEPAASSAPGPASQGPKGLKIKARKPGAPLELKDGETPAAADTASSAAQATAPAAGQAKSSWFGSLLPRKDGKGKKPLAGEATEKGEAAPLPTKNRTQEDQSAVDEKTGAPAPQRKSLFGSKVKATAAPEPAEKAKPVGAKPTSDWGSRFKRASTSSADKPQPAEFQPRAGVDAEDTAASPKKASAFSWGRKAKAAKAAEPASEKGTDPASKAKKGPSKSARADAPRGSVDLLLEMENGRRVYWRVSKNNVQELDESVVRRALSFSRAELRLKTSETLAFGPAQDLVLAELGEDARVVNGSRALKAVYAITVRRAEELAPVVSAPGLMLLDYLLEDKLVEGQPLLCALVIKGADDAARVAVLVHYTEAGELGALQVTVNPDNLNFVLSQFAASRRLNTEQTQVVLLSNAELLQAASKVPGYPSEALWRGYSVRKLTWGVTWAAVGIAAACALYAGKNFTSLQLAQSRIGEAQAKDKAAKASLDALLVSSVKSFARLQTLDLNLVTERAGEVWTPGSTVMVDAGITTQLYTTQLPLTRGVMLGNRPSVLEQTLPAHVRPLLERDPPQDCTKSLPEISGALNVVQITVTCESTPGPLAAYRLD